jgi:chromosome segregation ATPase
VASSKSPATPCPSPSAALSSTATTPTAEEYRALLLDLLLYRRETLEPVLAALRREREELETKMAQLETLVRELRHIREELRAFSEKKADEETQKLHTAITTAVAPPPRADEDGVSPPPMTRSSEADEIVL